MKAGKALVTDIFNRFKLLEIPFYQRSYVWREEQWERFMDDLEYLTAGRTDYFMGSLILKEVYVPIGNSAYMKDYMVIDGQQRLTTLIVFAKALCLKKNDGRFFDMVFLLSDGKPALRHSKSDNDAFEQVLRQTQQDKIQANPSNSGIIDAYNYFLENVDSDKYDLNVIMMGMQFVCIELEPKEDEQQVFDTINSLGMKLTTAELLKNYFFTNYDVTEYEKKWVPVFEKDAATRLYWDTEVNTGRGKRSMIDVFLDAYLWIIIQDNKYAVSTTDKLLYMRSDRLAKSYKDFIGDYLGGNKNDVINGIAEYAEIFKKNFDPEMLLNATPKAFGVERMNVILFGLKNTTLIPYLLFLLKEVDEKDRREFCEMCRILEAYVMRRILKQMTSKNYDSLFASLINSNVKTAKDLIARLSMSRSREDDTVPSDNDIHEAFHTAALYNIQAKGIVYLIESAAMPDESSVKLLGFNEYSLEHLMPKNWRKNWPRLSTEELEKARDAKLLTLGNLAIITQTLNAVIRDGEWEKKKNGEKYKNGLKDCTGGLPSMKDILNKQEWGESDIDERAEWLYEVAIKIWKV